MNDAMENSDSKIELHRLLTMFGGWVLGIFLLYGAWQYFVIDANELAFGAETSNILGTVDGTVAHCSDIRDHHDCVADWEKAGSPKAILWLGNSQLPAINKMQSGEKNAPQLLFSKQLKSSGRWLVTYSQPNANLTEHALLYQALAPIYKPELVILPVVFDDIREQGIRPDLVDFADFQKSPDLAKAGSVNGYIQPWLAGNKPIDTGVTENSLQERSEETITAALNKHWGLWESRPLLRGTLASAIHLLRNKALGIHSYTKRSVASELYENRMALLDELLSQIRDDGRQVLLYIPPYRDDIDGPYIAEEYDRFRADLQKLAIEHGATFGDFESIVPGEEWATVTDTIFGFQEPDFMHFTAKGHQRFAEAIDQQLNVIAH